MNQRGFQCGLKGEHANALPHTLEAPLMRLSVASLRRVVKGDLTIEFVPQALTSYGGLELLAPLSAPDRPGRAVAPGLRRAPQRLRQCADRAGAAGAVLRRGPAPRAPALPRRRSAGDALLRLGPVAHSAHRGRLVAPVHPGDAGAPRRPESGSRDRGAGAARAAAPDDRRGWVGHPDRRHGRLGLPRLQPASPEGPELLPAWSPTSPRPATSCG